MSYFFNDKLTVDDVVIDGKVITMTGSSADTATLTVAEHGALAITTTDDAGAAANITITADGTAELAGTTVTLNSGGDIILDADSSEILLKDGGATFGSLTKVDGSNNLIIKSGTTTALTFNGANVAVAGNLTVSGTTTTVNSTTVTIDDPIFTLGGDTAPESDDNKDRGIEFRYHDGTNARVGFFGYDDSAGGFTFLTAATNSFEVFSGTAGNILVGGISIGGTAVAATAAELNILDGVTASTTELNILDGVTATTAELNKLDGVTATATELNIVDGNTTISDHSTNDAVANGHGIVMNQGGTMKQVKAELFKTYIGAISTSDDNDFEGTNTFNGIVRTGIQDFTLGTSGSVVSGVDARGNATDLPALNRYNIKITDHGSNSAAKNYFAKFATNMPEVGTFINIFYLATTATSLEIDFGGAGKLLTGSGTAQYMTFNAKGQSASLFVVDTNTFAIINTGAAVA